MSKKVLKLAGQRPMLLALIVMATLTLGLLFSGWLTPTPAKAQSGAADSQPNQETTNCVVFSTSTQCTDGSVTLSNVPTTYECFGSGVGAMTTAIINPGQTVVTTCYTNEGNSGSSNCPPDIATNLVAPALLTNWWTASGCGISTNGSGLSTGSTPLIPTGGGQVTITFFQKWQHVCDAGTETASVAGMVNVIQITHQCVATTPTNQDRTTIGVCEEVTLTINPLPLGGVTWSLQGGGRLSSYTDPSITYTAPLFRGLQQYLPHFRTVSSVASISMS